MEVLVIGKPAINVYLPLVEFPQEGDLFTIRQKNESVGSITATSACLLASWGIKTHYTGVVGDDGYAEKLREKFSLLKVQTKFLETNYEHGTNVNYMILNTKTGTVTKVIYNNPEVNTIKHKYDFAPDWAVLDGSDQAATLALLNNDAKVRKVFYARIADKDTIAHTKRCTWNICTQSFAEQLTKEKPDGSPEGYVQMYQKIVDSMGSSNYIVILNNHKILYSEDGKVKMLPEISLNITDNSSFDSIFTGAFTFAIGNEVSLDDSLKLAQMAAQISLTKIGEAEAIPSIDDVLDNTGLREKLGLTTRRSVETQSVVQQEEQVQLEGGVQETVDEVANVQTEQAVMPVQDIPQTPPPQAEVQAPQQQETNMFDAPPPSESPVATQEVKQETNMFDQVQETNIFDNPQ